MQVSIIRIIVIPFTECCNESSTVVDMKEDNSIDTLAEDATVLSVEGGERGTEGEETMAGEEESEGLDEGESGTLAVSIVKDDAFEGDGSVSSGGAEDLLSGDGCAWGGEGSISADDGDCGRGDGGASVLLNEDVLSSLSLVLDTELSDGLPSPNIFLIIDHIENPERDILPY